MRKKLVVLYLLAGLFVLPAMGCGESGDSQDNPYAQYVEALSQKTQTVIKACRENKVGEVSKADRKVVFAAIKNVLANPSWQYGLELMSQDLAALRPEAKEAVRQTLVDTYNCLNTEQQQHALMLGKADETSGDNAISGADLSGTVDLGDYGKLTGSAKLGVDMVATVLGTVTDTMQGAMAKFGNIMQCLATITDCIAEVGWENATCMYESSHLHPNDATCAIGCCGHANIVETIGCLPSCGAAGAPAEKFEYCRDVIPPCPWD